MCVVCFLTTITITVTYYYYYYYYYYLGEDCEEVLADGGNNADLYVANQESTDLIREEAHVGDALFAFNGSSQDPFCYSRSLSLSLD